MRFIYTKAFTIGFAIFAGIAALIILDAAGYLGLLRDGFSRAFGTSEQQVAHATDSTKEFFQTLFTIRKLVYENAQLNQKINDLSFENARLQASKDENTALRNSLNFKQSSQLNLLAVEAVQSDPTGFSQIVTLDKGSDANIKMNSPVIVAPGLLVGKITAVYPHSSQVTLVTDPSISINGYVAETGASGLVQGEHGLALAFNLVSQNEVIKTQDMVLTSGLSGDFPRGLLVGQIDSIKSSSSDLFQQAFIAPAADLRNLRFLFVIQSP
jgi:rod shape-determining protein MreC